MVKLNLDAYKRIERKIAVNLKGDLSPRYKVYTIGEIFILLKSLMDLIYFISPGR
jgi:hypothetical protein